MNRSQNGDHISSLASKAKPQGNQFVPASQTNKKKSKSVGGVAGSADSSVFDYLVDDEGPSPCKMCNNAVTIKQKAILCSVCNVWVHLHCCNITPTQYKFLEDDRSNEFDWSCKKCREKKVTGKANGSEDKVIEHEIRLDTLQELITAVMRQNSLILQLLQNENRLEDKIRTHVTEALDAQREKLDRRENLIVFNIPECDSKNEAACKDHDRSELDSVLKHVDANFDLSTVPQNEIMRLGNKRIPTSSNPNPKPRPIRIKFSDGDSRKRILMNARSLAGSKFSRIGI